MTKSQSVSNQWYKMKLLGPEVVTFGKLELELNKKALWERRESGAMAENTSAKHDPSVT